MSKSTIWSIVTFAIVVLAIILIIIFVPNNKTNKTNSNNLTAAQKAADATSIKDSYVTFFAANTAMSTRAALLQNGSQFSQAMQGEFSQLANEKPSVTLNSVNVTNPSTASVNYTVDLNGQPVLKDQNGSAVKVNGKWLVSDLTLCQLLGMAGQSPSICKNIH
jgi:hypothetical protein